jgi:hypothetical protein
MDAEFEDKHSKPRIKESSQLSDVDCGTRVANVVGPSPQHILIVLVGDVGDVVTFIICLTLFNRSLPSNISLLENLDTCDGFIKYLLLC